MSNKIIEIASKYNKNHIKARLNDVYANAQLKIGFVGMFSAGKTTLINSLLGTHLPVDINPTTKSICIIEATEGIEAYEYYLEENGMRKESSFPDFEAMVSGGSTGVAVVKVPANEIIPNGVIFVDTPGVDNYSADETILAKQYLAFLDAAVVCIDIADGTLKQEVKDFISSPSLAALSERMIFALTHADKKLNENAETVKKEVLSQLRKMSGESHFSIDKIEERIVTVNGKNPESAQSVIKLIRDKILVQRKEIVADRICREEKAIAVELKSLLDDDMVNLSFDTADLDKKKTKLQLEREKFEEQLARRQKALRSIEDTLHNQISSILGTHELELSNATSQEQFTKIFERIAQEIEGVAEAASHQLAKDMPKPSADLGTLASDLYQTVQRINYTRDLGVLVGTALLTAGVGSGTSIAANAAEAAAGAAAQQIGRKAAEKTVDDLSEIVIKASHKPLKDIDLCRLPPDVIHPPKGPGKNLGNTLGKILKGVATVIHNINPLEQLGDWAAAEAKHKSYSTITKAKAGVITSSIIEQLEEPFNQIVLMPIREQIIEKENAIENLIEERKNGIMDSAAKREEIRADLAELSKLIDS